MSRAGTGRRDGRAERAAAAVPREGRFPAPPLPTLPSHCWTALPQPGRGVSSQRGGATSGVSGAGAEPQASTERVSREDTDWGCGPPGRSGWRIGSLSRLL